MRDTPRALAPSWPRRQAACALGEIGGQHAVAALKRAAGKDKEKSVRGNAKEALAKAADGSEK